MTTEELRILFNNTFGLGEWPDKFEVDHETYANVCQDVFNNKSEDSEIMGFIELALGPSNGIYFRNVELILKR